MPLTSDAVKDKAIALGFDLCGVAAVDDYPELGFFETWLDKGYAGEMRYLHRTADRRRDVRHVIAAARSVIVTATVYNTDRPYSVERDDPGVARIARYAWGDDYHDVLQRRLDALLAWMRESSDVPFEARAYVDTGPVQERVYAQYAGLGWIGKNTCVISAKRGSWLFLSEIICSLALDADVPATDRCGTCTKCLEACPTGALVESWVLDARRCISYLTIELRGGIPAELREGVGSHVYGCDICQDVCPWNRTPLQSSDPAWQPRRALDGPRTSELWRSSDDDLRRTLKGSPVKRAKLAGLRRNLAVALGNQGNGAVADELNEPHEGPEWQSLQDPGVAEHVSWARVRAGAHARVTGSHSAPSEGPGTRP